MPRPGLEDYITSPQVMLGHQGRPSTVWGQVKQYFNRLRNQPHSNVCFNV